MFDKRNRIVIFIYENVMLYPPTINLMECLLVNGYKVHLVGEGTKDLPELIRDNSLFTCHEVQACENGNIVKRLKKRKYKTDEFRKELSKVGSNDIVWTVNPVIVRTLGEDLLKYSDRHVMQLMELTDECPLFKGAKRFKFNIRKYGQNAWKMVVPEENRAYIQKVGWNLDNLPYVLPNKPYYLDPGALTEEMQPVVEKMLQEKRKIIIYLGVLDPDRDFESFAEAIETIKDEYALYMFGSLRGGNREQFDAFCKKYSCVRYMGFFNPPKHLYFLRYAHIALVPYKPGAIEGAGFSILNALYCAPNKIFEYAGNNLPMVGTDVLGLKASFEKYNIGVCCKNLQPDTIVDAIKYVDRNHDEMQKNCMEFYNSVNIDNIIDRIINE